MGFIPYADNKRFFFSFPRQTKIISDSVFFLGNKTQLSLEEHPPSLGWDLGRGTNLGGVRV